MYEFFEGKKNCLIKIEKEYNQNLQISTNLLNEKFTNYRNLSSKYLKIANSLYTSSKIKTYEEFIFDEKVK